MRKNRVWLIAGTGEGPALARHFLREGWRVRVSVVTPSAGQPYGEDPRLELQLGPIAGAGALANELETAKQQGDPFRWLIDASHPFAEQITAAAFAATQDRPEQLLRLHRPVLEAPQATVLRHISDLASDLPKGERLLLAIGARHLQEATRAGAAAHLFSRVLPHPRALQQAVQAGIAPEHIACLRPSGDGAVEKALCEHWQITAILCRQSGGVSESLWHRLASELDLRLFLLKRPSEPEDLIQLPFAELIEHVGRPEEPTDGAAVGWGWSEPRASCAGAHHRGQPGDSGETR